MFGKLHGFSSLHKTLWYQRAIFQVVYVKFPIQQYIYVRAEKNWVKNGKKSHFWTKMGRHAKND